GCRGHRRQGDSARLRIPPDRRSALVAEDPTVSQPQVHLQHGVPGIRQAPGVHRAARGAPVGPRSRRVPGMGQPVSRAQGCTAAGDWGRRSHGREAGPSAGALPVRMAERGAAVNPIGAWNRFFFGLVSARPLAVFRIVYGVLLMIYLALMTGEFDYWYTGAGLLQGSEAREAAGPLRFSPLQYVQDPITPRLVLGATFAAALGLTLGWRPRLMGIVLYLGFPSLSHRNVSSKGGPAAGPLILAFYMMLCPGGAAYSLDARREARSRGTAAERIIAPWGQRLLQMQLCLI